MSHHDCGSAAVPVFGAAGGTVVTRGTLAAAFPAPLPFNVSIARGSGALTGDPAFDKVCSVETEDEARARALLADPGLRQALAKLFDSWVRNVAITREGVMVQFFDVREFRQGVQDALDIASRLAGRGRELG